MPLQHHPNIRTALIATFLLVTLAPATGQDSPPATAGAIPERTPAEPGVETSPTTGTSTDQQIKVFQLKNAEAAQTAVMVNQLFKDIGVEADKRTNSLIVAGTPEDLDIIEAILLRLDQTPTKPQVPTIANDSQRADLDSTRSDFSAKEAEVRSLAQGIAKEDDTEAAKQLRAKLNRLVVEAFDLRQKLQRAELALLKERIQIVETRLQQRETLRDEIIRRRVESLLADGPDPQSVNQNRTAPQTAAKTHAETKADASDVAYQPMRTGSSWVSDDVIRFLRSEDRAAAWEAAYEEQCSRNAWPPPLSPQFHESIKRLGPDASIPSKSCEEYQRFIRVHAPCIDEIIDRRRPRQLEAAPALDDQAEAASPSGAYGASSSEPELVGTVEWNESDYARIQAGFYWVKRPSTSQVRLAQEDLWCYESVLRAIAKINKDAGASSHADAPIKRIETLEIGQPAAAAMTSIRPKLAFRAYFGEAYELVDWVAREEIAGSAATGASDMLEGPVTDERLARILRTGRYVDLSAMALPADSQPYPEFNLLPVHIVVDIDPARLPDFLAQLAACAMPVEATYVEADNTHGEEDSDAYGAPVRKQYVRAEIFGLIRIFNPPDQSKLTDDPSRSASSSKKLVRMDFRHQPWQDVLEWLAEVSGVELQLKTVPEGVFNYTSSEPEPVENVLETIRTVLATSGYRLSESTFRGKQRLTVSAMEWEGFRRQILEAQQETARWKKALEEPGQQGDADYLATVENRLDQAQRDERILREGTLQRLRTYEMKLQGEERQAETARQKWEDLKKLLAKGHATQEEVDAAETDFNKTEAACRFTRNYVEGFRKTAQETGIPVPDPDASGPLGAQSGFLLRTPEKSKNEAEGTEFEPPQGTAQEQPDTTTSTASSPSTLTSQGARPTLQLRTPADFQSAARDAKKQVGLMQAKLDGVLGNREQLEDDPDFDYTAYLNSVKEDLSSAKLQLDLIQSEFIAQVRNLELEVERLNVALETVGRSLMNSPSLTRAEKEDLLHERADLQLRISQARTLLELYLKAAENPDLNPGFGEKLEGKQAGSEGLRNQAEVLPQHWAKTLFLETRHDFGTVAEGAKLQHRFTIANPYLEDLHIARVTASAGLSAHITKTLLKTHETADIVVEVDPRQFSTAASSRVMVEIDKPFPAQVQLDVRLSEETSNEARE